MESCYGGGSIAAAVIGTFCSTLVAVALAHFVWKRRKEKQNPLRDLVLVENGDDKMKGIENRGFKDDFQDEACQNTNRQGLKATTDNTRFETTTPRKGPDQVNGENAEGSRKSSWANLGFLFNHGKGGTGSSESPQGLNYSVNLKGHDFTGLGFTLTGGVKPGVFIKEVMQRGPAAVTNQMSPGDRIRSMAVSFDDIVLPDAMAIMGHASPYSIKLDLTRHGGQAVKSTGSVTSPEVTNSREQEIIETPAVVSEASPVDRAAAMHIEMESVQMKSPDILDMRPSAFPRNKDKKQMQSAQKLDAEQPTTARSPTPKLIACVDVPDSVLHHMEGLTPKENTKVIDAEPMLSVPKAVENEQKMAPEVESQISSELPLVRGVSSMSVTSEQKQPMATKESPIPMSRSKSKEEKDRPKSMQDDLVSGTSSDTTSKNLDKDRPASADSASSKAKFHIRLFHKSKQYSLDHEPSPPKSPGMPEDELLPTVRKMETEELEANLNSQPPTSAKTEDRHHEDNFVTKGLKSIRDLTGKISQRLSIHDSHSSDSESADSPHAKGRKKKSSENKTHKNSSSESKKHPESDVSADLENCNATETALKNKVKDDDSSEVEGEDGTPKKPKKSIKRKAPIPPVEYNSTVSTTVEIHLPADQPPKSPTSALAGIETRRSASYGELRSTPTPPLNLTDRAVSLDMHLTTNNEGQMTLADVVNDLSCSSDRPLHMPHLTSASSQTSSSSSQASSSSETLTEGTILKINGELRPQNDKVEKLPESVGIHHSPPKSAEVGISERDQAEVAIREEIERIANETVREVLKKAQENLEANPDGDEVRKAVKRSISQDSNKKPSRIPVPAGKAGHSPPDPDGRGHREDRKTRLMQTVADANDIKLSPPRITPPKTIELSPKELDKVMMSHSEFLARQEGTAPPKDSSFDSWIYVDQKLQLPPTDTPPLTPEETEVTLKQSGNDSYLPGSGGSGVVFSTTMTIPVNNSAESDGKRFAKIESPEIQLPNLEPSTKS